MNITITSEAVKKIDQINEAKDKFLLLHYDTVDCGCGVNGLPTVRLTSQKDDSFISVDSNEYQVIIHHHKAVFFAREMKLDFIGNVFRLSGPDGILNPIIPQTDLIKGDVA